MKLQVKGYESLVRDTKSNAIVNTDRQAYFSYIQMKRKREVSNDKLRDVVKEVTSLKKELFEIKDLLTKVVNKG